MRAIEFKNEIKIHTDYPTPDLKPDEALIKVHLAGICNTDIEITKGYMNFSGILGHEFVGTVEKINGNSQELLNKRVVGEINCFCGKCEYCKNNLATHCPDRTVLGIFNKDGCFADYITLPVENLFEVPEFVTDEEAVFVEPLAAAFEVMTQVFIKPTDKILVLGDGKLGILCALALKLSRANLTIVGKHKEKLDIAKDQGVNTILLENLKTEKAYDIVVEATGTIEGFELAQSLTKPRGAIVLKSTAASDNNINLSQIVIDEITIVGSRCGPFKPAIQALERGLIDVKPLITKTFPFNQSKEAVDFSKTKGILKVLIDFK